MRDSPQRSPLTTQRLRVTRRSLIGSERNRPRIGQRAPRIQPLRTQPPEHRARGHRARGHRAPPRRADRRRLAPRHRRPPPIRHRRQRLRPRLAETIESEVKKARPEWRAFFLQFEPRRYRRMRKSARRRQCLVALGEKVLTRFPRSLDSPHPDMLGARREFERIATPNHDVSVVSRRQ